jgi:hypothetical protein
MRTVLSWIAAVGLTAFMFPVAVGLAGGGHGWNGGALCCLALMPVNLVALLNGFREEPSAKVAMTVLRIGLGICAFAALDALFWEAGAFRFAMRRENVLSLAFLFLLCFQWLLVSALILWNESDT